MYGFYPLRLRSNLLTLEKADVMTITTVTRPARPRKAITTSAVEICMCGLVVYWFIITQGEGWGKCGKPNLGKNALKLSTLP